MTTMEFKNMMDSTFKDFFGFSPVKEQEQPKETVSSSISIKMTEDEFRGILDSTFNNFFGSLNSYMKK